MNIIIFLLYHVSFMSISAGTLRVTITDLRNDDGHVLLAIYDSAEGFPSSNESTIRDLKGTIKDGVSIFKVDDLPTGEYAIAVFHDENDNEELDTNLVGIPKEGTGASNNAKGFMGPPKYSDAMFDLGEEVVEMKIKMAYF